MSQIIQFLNTLGANSAAANLTAAQYAATVAVLDAPDEQRRALLDRDHLELGRLLGGRDKLICMIYAEEEQ